LHNSILFIKNALEFTLLQVTNQYLLLLSLAHLAKLPELILLEDAEGLHVLGPLALGLLLHLVRCVICRSAMRSLASSCVVCLPFDNIKEFPIALFAKSSLGVLIQAVFVSGGLAMVIDVYAHFGHLLLLNVDEFGFLFSLEMSEYVYFLCCCHCFDVIYCNLWWSERHVWLSVVEAAEPQLLADSSRGVDEALLLLCGTHGELLLVAGCDRVLVHHTLVRARYHILG